MGQPVMPQLVLDVNGQRRTLDPGRTYTIGRDPQSDLVFDDTRVSWRHATVSWTGGDWSLDDHGSTNGTYVDGLRAARVPLGGGAVVLLGNAEDGPRLAFSPAGPADQGRPAAYPQDAGAQGRPAQAAHAAAASGGAGRPQAPGFPGQAQGFPHQGFPGQGFPGQAQAVPVQSAAGVPAQGGVRPSGATPGPGTRNPTMVRDLARGMRTVRIGRGPDNDLVISDLQVSRHHAELRQLADGRYEIADLESHNGVFVNGRRVSRHVLAPDDTVGIGHSTFRLVGDRLEEFVDTGEVTFSARRLTVRVEHKGRQKVLLNNVSFGVPEKSLVAVIGPSGSGKSTLLRALTGYRPADEGDVLYDGRNLYRHFAELRQRIGLVPQDDILHSQLTVRRALRYAAELRFPGDTEAAERDRRVDEVLHELRLEQRADNRITALSGGQRKRVSVALELLTKPSLIFLDEPTSGLDPGMDREVMQMLRGLADDGRTVLVVTHSVAELALCDRLLVMAPGGSVAYFGPPEEALHFFGYQTWADVFQAFENYPEHDWAGRYRGSVHYQMYSAEVEAEAPQSAAIHHEQSRPAKPQSWGSQLGTLIRRYLAVIGSDRGFLALSVLLPAVLGVVSIIIPDKGGFGVAPGHTTNSDAGTVLLMLAVGACFSGAANSVRELIKERVIYERERATGLSRSAYLMSKVIVLGMVSVVQAAIICAINFTVEKMPAQGLVFTGAPWLEMGIAVVLLSIVSMMVGLAISSLVKTAEKTMPLLVMFAIVQVAFTGALFKVYDSPGVEQVAWLMPSRWAVAQMATTVNLAQIFPIDQSDNPPKLDPLWTNSAGQWFLDAGVLVVLGVLLGFLVLRLLRRHEPEVMRSR